MFVDDSKQYRFGVVSAAPPQFPAIALDELSNRRNGDFRALLRDPEKRSRPEAWALVSFLLSERAQLFMRWAAELDSGATASEAYQEVFAAEDDLTDEYQMWLREKVDAQDFHYLIGSWRYRDEVLLGSSRRRPALAILKQQPERLVLEVEQSGDVVCSGLVFDYRSSGDMMAVLVTRNGGIELTEYRDHAASSKALNVNRLNLNGSHFTIELYREGDTATVSVNNVPILYHHGAAASKCGVAVHCGDASFKLRERNGSRAPARPLRCSERKSPATSESCGRSRLEALYEQPELRFVMLVGNLVFVERIHFDLLLA
jgi:hypothetical protein